MSNQPHRQQSVWVEFTRSGSIAPGPRHPWCWAVLIQSGHIYTVKTGFATLADAAADFAQNGVAVVEQVESQLARAYARPGQPPYDWNAQNPPKEI